MSKAFNLTWRGRVVLLLAGVYPLPAVAQASTQAADRDQIARETPAPAIDDGAIDRSPSFPTARLETRASSSRTIRGPLDRVPGRLETRINTRIERRRGPNVVSAANAIRDQVDDTNPNEREGERSPR